MPIVFDFDNGVDGITNSNFTNTTQSIGYSEAGIDFTFSPSSLTGTAFAQFGGTNPVQDAFFLANGSDGADVFHLTFGGSMSGTAGDQIVVQAGNASFSGSYRVSVTHSTLGGTMTQVLNGSGQAASFTGTYTGIKFTTLSVSNFAGFESISVKSINCFLGDVLIATPIGEVEARQLKAGDKLTTADGGETTVRWIGTQDVDTRLCHPDMVNPICISAGSLAANVPARDLHVSRDHAVEIDGLLINAGALVNGSTIYQVAKMPMDGFTYYHIETDAHELLLAEGAAAESFIDYAGRDSFGNGEEAKGHIPEMDLPRISSARLVPGNIREALMPAIAAE